MSHLSGYHLLPTDEELSDWYIPGPRSSSSSIEEWKQRVCPNLPYPQLTAEEFASRFRPRFPEYVSCDSYDPRRIEKEDEMIRLLLENGAENRHRAAQIEKRTRADWRGPMSPSVRPKRYRPRTLKYIKSHK